MSHTHRSPNQDTSRRNLTGPLRKARAAKHARLRPRQLRCEPLEDRRLLSVFTYENPTSKAIPDKGTLTSTISVPDAYITADVNVTVNMTHTRDEDLDVFLIAPDGTRVELFTDVGGTGDHFTTTVLDDSATTSITTGKAPFTDTFRPEGNLSLVEGKQVQGTWKLEVTDDTKKETGKLNSWSINVTSAGVPAGDNFIDTNATMLGNVRISERKVIVSNNGDAMAVWQESKGLGDTGPWNVMAARYVAGSWSTPEVIMEGNSLNYGYSLDLAGDGFGNYLAVTVDLLSTNQTNLIAKRYVATEGHWRPAEVFGAGEHGSPQASMAYDPNAVDVNGVKGVTRAVVAWANGYSGTGGDAKIVRLDNFTTGTWSDVEIAESQPFVPGISWSSIDVAMAQNGDFMLVFAEDAADNLSPRSAYYRVYRQGGGWEESEALLETLPEGVGSTQVEMNSSGEAMVWWKQGTGKDGLAEMWARRWNGVTWDTVSQKIVDRPGEYTGFLDGRVALSENGEAVMFWSQQPVGSTFGNAYVRHHDGTQWGDIVKLDTEDLGSVGVGGNYGINAGEMKIAMDDAGNAAAVWTQSDGTYINMWASQFDGANWSTAEKLENAARDAVLPSVDMSAGVAQVIWTQSNGLLNHMYSATLPRPTLLDTNPAMLGNVSTSCSDVAVSENGDAMAMWLESKGAGDTGPLMAMAARYDAGTGKWETPAIISDPSFTWGVQTWGRIATDGQGNYLAAWQQAVSSVDAGRGYGSIWVNRYVAGSGWQTPQTIETDTNWSYDPVVAMAYDPVDGVSKAVVVWTYGSEMKVNRLTDFAANTWSGATLAENLSLGIFNGTHAVDMAANGDFLIAFQTDVAPSDLYSRHYDWSVAAWSGPETALESQSAAVSNNIGLDMNDAGDAIVSWTQSTGTLGARQVWARRWDGSDWGPAEVLSDDPDHTVALRTTVAISDNGEAAVLYVQPRAGTQYKDAYVRRHTAAGWQDIVKVDTEDLGDVYNSGPTGNGQGPTQIAMDDSGNIMAVWQQSDGVFSNIWGAKFDRSTSIWSPAAKLEDSPYDAGNIAMAMNSSGDATTIWVQPDNTLTHIYASRNTPALSAPVATLAALSGNDTALASMYDVPVKKLRIDTVRRSESRTVESHTRDLSYTVGASANRLANDNGANDNHRQTEVDDLFAQWDSDPLELLSLSDLGM